MPLEFEARLKKLNKEQRLAVEAIDGPVMVIAGPGTGKTEILSLRIANILKETDTPASGILALTFTNSGVKAMRQRLISLIGPTASGVTISTFHSFGISLLSEFYDELGLSKPPTLIDDRDTIVLYDELLQNNDWKYIRTRSGGAHMFQDLKSVISLLKQEHVSPEKFMEEIEVDIFRIENDPESISTRGESKGNLKAAEKEKIERLERTKEVATFYDLYEKTKKERGLADYNDILEYIVLLVQKSDNARNTLRERFLYVLVDEHQDSSGVQNDFLEAVWKGVEKPNLFVVGDDRQLIYAFGGASLSHFERFGQVFAPVKTIALKENHRSTQNVLNLAGALLQSALTSEKLQSVKKDSHEVLLIEAEYPRDEILSAGITIKQKIKEGAEPNECAVLLPKRSQVKSALTLLHELGIPTASRGNISFFSTPQTDSLILLLKVLSDPYDNVSISKMLIDPAFGVPFLVSQKHLRESGKKLSFDLLLNQNGEIGEVGEMIKNLISKIAGKNVYEIIQIAGEELFFKREKNHKNLTIQIEVVRTMLHLSLTSLEKNHKLTLSDFVGFVERMEEYGHDIPLAVFESGSGVTVDTLHSSKGLEFDFVWLGHLDENSVMKQKQLAVTLPEKIKDRVSKKDELAAKRELYVGMTRARKFLTLSFAKRSYAGIDQHLSKIIQELPEDLYTKKQSLETEKEIRKENELSYVLPLKAEVKEDVKKEIVDFVKTHFSEKPVSVTHLNNFYTCPWRWYFRNFLALPEIETESLIFGNLVHIAIERIIKEKIDDDRKLISSILDNQKIFDSKIRNRFGKDALNLLTRFRKNYLENYSSAISETKVSNYRDPDFSEIEVSGKIDVIQKEKDESYTVTDFKTGSVKNHRDVEKLDEDGRMSDLLRQLSMYSYLLQNQRVPIKVSLSKLLFLEAGDLDKNSVYQRVVTQNDIELLRKDIGDFVELLVSGKWIEIPCKVKHFGQTRECEYCKMAKNLL